MLYISHKQLNKQINKQIYDYNQEKYQQLVQIINQNQTKIKKKMQFNAYFNDLHINPYFYVPIINQNSYSFSYIENFNPFQNYDMNQSMNNYCDYNKPSIKSQQNIDSLQEKSPSITKNPKFLTNKLESSADQYVPEKELGIKLKKKWQNAKRNVTSTLLNQASLFLIQQKKSGYLVQRLLQTKKYNTKLLKKYFEFQINRNRRLPRYKSTDNFINSLITKSKQDQTTDQYNERKLFCCIARSILAYYLKNIAIGVITNSKKVLPINRNYYFSAVRKILQLLKINPKLNNKENQLK